MRIMYKKNGEGGIRTPGTLMSTLVFETSSISHSDTSPNPGTHNCTGIAALSQKPIHRKLCSGYNNPFPGDVKGECNEKIVSIIFFEAIIFYILYERRNSKESERFICRRGTIKTLLFIFIGCVGTLAKEARRDAKGKVPFTSKTLE